MSPPRLPGLATWSGERRPASILDPTGLISHSSVEWWSGVVGLMQRHLVRIAQRGRVLTCSPSVPQRQ